jgi:MFS family permease
LSGSHKSALILTFLVGAFFGSLFTAFVGEQLGRKWSICIGVIVMMVGSLLQATAYTRAHLIVARIVAGFGLGAVNSTAPVFLAEFAPKATRGLCMSTNHLSPNPIISQLFTLFNAYEL